MENYEQFKVRVEDLYNKVSYCTDCAEDYIEGGPEKSVSNFMLLSICSFFNLDPDFGRYDDDALRAKYEAAPDEMTGYIVAAENILQKYNVQWENGWAEDK